MQHVWFLFKFLEVIIGVTSLCIHILSLDDTEPLPHVVFYCGTFFGFTLISFFGTIGILLGRGPKPQMEAITNSTASIMYIFAAFLAMYHAEQDFHLMYLSDFEEPLHNFFKHCKYQSIASLANGFLYLLHSIYAFDLCFITKRQVNIFEDEHEEASQPLRLYFISETVQKYLEKYEWFRRYSVGDFSKPSDYRFTIRQIPGSRQRKSSGAEQDQREDVSVTSVRENLEESIEQQLSGGCCEEIASTSGTLGKAMQNIEIFEII